VGRIVKDFWTSHHQYFTSNETPQLSL
jgi:hypothetical protein